MMPTLTCTHFLAAVCLMQSAFAFHGVAALAMPNLNRAHLLLQWSCFRRVELLNRQLANMFK